MIADSKRKQKGNYSGGNRAFKIAGILVILATIFFVFVDYKIYQKKKELVAQISEYQKQIKDIERSSQTLKKEIANNDDPAYIEKVAREQENMQKPGEKVVSFISAKTQQESQQKAENFWSAEFWFGWISWIKNKF